MKDLSHEHREPAVVRLKPEPHELERAAPLLESHIREQVAALARDWKIGDVALRPGELDAETVRRESARLSHLFRIRPQPVRDVEVFSGCQLIPPPYDVNWATGAGWSLSRFDGEA